MNSGTFLFMMMGFVTNSGTNFDIKKIYEFFSHTALLGKFIFNIQDCLQTLSDALKYTGMGFSSLLA